MIYADYNATTPCLPEVAEAVRQCLLEDFGNPSSRHHLPGRRAHELRETARDKIAGLLGAAPDELTFTSGATEALNTAIFGVVARQLRTRPKLLVAAAEHEAVLAVAEHCAAVGAEVERLPVDAQGRLDREALRDACDERCGLVCAMLVNNETGVVEDIPAIADIVHESGALLCCDCTQALGKRPLDLHALGCDLAACSGHKCYAPKGIGCLWKRRGLGIDPLIFGGGQERGLRSGTENLPAIHGFGLAAAWLRDHQGALRDHLAGLTTGLETELREGLPALRIFGEESERVPGTTMLAHPKAKAGWLRRLSRVACSPGSSCASGSTEPSHVLTAMGVERALAANALRLSLGWQTTADEVTAIAEHLISTA